MYLASFLSWYWPDYLSFLGCMSCENSYSLYSSNTIVYCSDSVLVQNNKIENCSRQKYSKLIQKICLECKQDYLLTDTEDKCVELKSIKWGGSPYLLK